MEFQLSCSKSWKMMLWKCYSQYARKFWKLSSGYRTGKGHFSFQSQRKAMPKNVQTTAQLDSSHMLAKKSSKFSKQGFKQDMNQELPDIQAWFRKGRGTRDQIANIHWIREKARIFQKNMFFCFIDYTKAFDCLDHNKLWKILKEMGIPDHLTCLLRNLYADKEATEPDTEQLTGSKLGKEYNKAVCCHLVYLTSMQSIYHGECWAEWITSWIQECPEK